MAEYKYKGIDVSKHQGKINWAQVASSGIEFVMIRAGYGMYATQEDAQFKANIEGAYAAGIKNIGVYWYSYATTVEQGIKEAQVCLNVISKYKDKINLPVFFDQEYEQSIKNITRSARTEIVKNFCKAVYSAGYRTGIYASKDWLENWVTVSSFDSYIETWVAQYNSSCTYKGSHIVWQYSSTGKVSGISGNVDMDKATASLIVGSSNSTPKWEKTSAGWKYGTSKNKWEKINDIWYYFDANGIAVTGWHQIKGIWYYFLTQSDADRTGGKECSCYSIAK